MNAREKRHLSKVAELGCALCNRQGVPGSPAEIHHPRESQGMSQRADNWLAFGLCPEHHRGKTGIHGLGKSAFEARYRCTELDLLADTIEKLVGR